MYILEEQSTSGMRTIRQHNYLEEQSTAEMRMAQQCYLLEVSGKDKVWPNHKGNNIQYQLSDKERLQYINQERCM